MRPGLGPDTKEKGTKPWPAGTHGSLPHLETGSPRQTGVGVWLAVWPWAAPLASRACFPICKMGTRVHGSEEEPALEGLELGHQGQKQVSLWPIPPRVPLSWAWGSQCFAGRRESEGAEACGSSTLAHRSLSVPGSLTMLGKS